MSRPPLEVADLIRAAGEAFIERNRHWMRWKHLKVLRAIARCRTAALGGHLDECTRCGHRAISFNSCRDRHCPKCQIAARERWIAARQRELLPTRYVHVVFTLPRRLAPLVLQNKKLLYDLLFRTSAETLLEVARNPLRLGAEIGFFSVLHTWSQKLELHPHVHCVVPAGGLSPDHTRWVRSRDNYFLPKKVLRKIFRGKFVDALKQAFQNGQLNFHGDLATPRSAQDLRRLATASVPATLGGVLETPLRWPPICAAISGPLHPSRGHLQSSPGLLCRWTKSPFAGAIRPTTTSRNSCLYRSTSSCAASYCISFRKASCASATSASSPTGGVPRSYRFAFTFSARHHNRKPNKTSPSTKDSSDLWHCPKCGGPMQVVERLTAAEIQLRSPPAVTVAA